MEGGGLKGYFPILLFIKKQVSRKGVYRKTLQTLQNDVGI
jgi:hypothetical protein